MNQEGVSFLETLVVMALVALILIIGVPWTLNQIRHARAEAEIRTLYSNITEARQRTIERNYPYIVNVSNGAVDVYEDQNANGTADPTEKVSGLSLKIGSQDFKVTGNVGANNIPTNGAFVSPPMSITIRGIVLQNSTLWLTGYDTDPGVRDAQRNCIRVDSTRIAQGKYNANLPDNKCERQ